MSHQYDIAAFNTIHELLAYIQKYIIDKKEACSNIKFQKSQVSKIQHMHFKITTEIGSNLDLEVLFSVLKLNLI